jgi:hypothetical protein
MVTLADIPCAAQLIREARAADPLYRDPGEDRRMLSANDWYGIGVLFHLTGQGHTVAMRRRVYCGGRAAYEQFMLGKRHAQQDDIWAAIGK